MLASVRQDVAVSADIKYAQFNILCYNRENIENTFQFEEKQFQKSPLLLCNHPATFQQRKKLSTFSKRILYFSIFCSL